MDGINSSDQATASALVEDGLATVEEASKFLGLCRSRLYSEMDSGNLSYCKLGKSRRIPWRSIKALAAQSLVGS